MDGGLWWQLSLAFVFLGTVSSNQPTGCTPVIYRYTDNQAKVADGLESVTQTDFQLRHERLFACAYLSEDPSTNPPQWSVPETQQSVSWSFPTNSLDYPFRKVSFLTSYTSGLYTCGFPGDDATAQAQVNISLEPLKEEPVSELTTELACQPEIFLTTTGSPLKSQVIQAVHGRNFADFGCRCLGAGTSDGLYWTRNGVRLTGDSDAVITLDRPEGPIVMLNVTVDRAAYQTTFTCQTGPRYHSFTLEAVSPPVATRILRKVQNVTVDTEEQVTCVSVGGNPQSATEFLLRRSDETRRYQPPTSETDLETLGNVQVVAEFITLMPDWTMADGWELVCEASNSHHAVWDRLVNGVVSGEADVFAQDDSYRENEKDDAKRSRDSMPLHVLPSDVYKDVICSPEIYVDKVRQDTSAILPVAEQVAVELNCQCSEFKAFGGDERIPIWPIWALRGTALDINRAEDGNAKLTVTPSRKDERPVYTCYGRQADSVSIMLDVRTKVENVTLTSEYPQFVKAISNRITCTVNAVNPSPFFRFVIALPNGSAEDVSSESVTKTDSIDFYAYPPVRRSVAQFDFIPDGQHEGAQIVCVVSQVDYLLLVPHPIDLHNTEHPLAKILVNLVSPSAPVITAFYTVPAVPVLGEPVEFFCMVDTNAPLWDIRVENNQTDQSVTVHSNHPLLLRDAEVPLPARYTATLGMAGKYRCQASSSLGEATPVFHDLLVKAPPVVHFTLHGHRDFSVIHVQDEVALRLQLEVNEQLPTSDKPVIQCWKGRASNYYQSPVSTHSIEAKGTAGKAYVSQLSISGASQAESPVYTCRARNEVGTSAPASVHLKLDTYPSGNLSYVVLPASEDKATRLVVTSLLPTNGGLFASYSNSKVPLRQTMRVCPVQSDQPVECLEASTPRHLAASSHVPYNFTFDISNFTKVQNFNLETVSSVNGELLYQSHKVPVGKSHNYMGHGPSPPGSLSIGLKPAIIICISLLSVCAVSAAAGLIFLLSRYHSYRQRKHNEMVQRVMASDKFKQVAARRAYYQDSFLRNLQVQIDDPIVTILPSKSAPPLPEKNSDI